MNPDQIDKYLRVRPHTHNPITVEIALTFELE